MTEQEAINVLIKNVPKCCKLVNGQYKGGFDNWDCDMGQAIRVAVLALQDIQNYQKIGTVEECREAVEKQKPKKPHRNYKKFSGLWCKCGWYLGQKQCLDIKYCPNCGQAIDGNLEGMEDE